MAARDRTCAVLEATPARAVAVGELGGGPVRVGMVAETQDRCVRLPFDEGRGQELAAGGPAAARDVARGHDRRGRRARRASLVDHEGVRRAGPDVAGVIGLGGDRRVRPRIERRRRLDAEGGVAVARGRERLGQRARRVASRVDLHGHGRPVAQGGPGDPAEVRCGVVKRVAIRGLVENHLWRLVVDQSGRVVILDAGRREERPVNGHLVDIAPQVTVVGGLADLKGRCVAHVARHGSCTRPGSARVDVDADPGVALPADDDVMPRAVVHAAGAVELPGHDPVLEVCAHLSRVIRVVGDGHRPGRCRVLLREQTPFVVCGCPDERLGREVVGAEVEHPAGRVCDLDEVVASVEAGARVRVRGQRARHAEHDAVLVDAVAGITARVCRRRARGLAEPPVARGGVGHDLVVVRRRPGGIGVAAQDDCEEHE